MFSVGRRRLRLHLRITTSHDARSAEKYVCKRSTFLLRRANVCPIIMSARRRVRVPKGVLPFKQHGGARPGAGRKPKGDVAGVAHRVRSKLAARFPAHVTVKLSRGLPRLRRGREYAALRAAFAA